MTEHDEFPADEPWMDEEYRRDRDDAKRQYDDMIEAIRRDLVRELRRSYEAAMLRYQRAREDDARAVLEDKTE